jgi:hypothetical protein
MGRRTTDPDWAPDQCAKRVRDLLTRLGRNPYELAPFLEVTPQAIYGWMRGENVPGPRIRAAIERAEGKLNGE